MNLLPSIINNTENLYEGNLRHYARKIFRLRSSRNPYHNIRHSFDVLIKCHEAIRFYKNPGGREDHRLLLISALYHDADHSGRMGHDDLNIILACRAIENDILPQDKPWLNFLQKSIKSTEYGPGGHVHEADSELERILRDADISQCISNTWIRHVIFGLAEEAGISPLEMLLKQEEFLSNVEFESRWGRETMSGKIKEKIGEVKELIEIFN